MRDGKIRGIAMVGDRRFPLYPDIPTLGELGVPGFDNGGFFLLIGPAGLPPRVAQALNRALQRTLAEPIVRDRMLTAGHEPPLGPNDLAAARAFMEREYETYRKIVEQTGVRLQP